MSLRIRLSRVGAKKQASYRIVVAESNAPRDGKAIAILGHYNPLSNPYTLKVDEERTVRWLKSGAQPSETARGLLAKAGVITAYEAVRKGPAQPKKATGDATEETKARRAARAKRTEAPRLVRPAHKEGAAEAEKPVRATTAAKKPAAGKTATKAKAAAKSPASKGKAATARKTATASRTTKAKATADKKS
ncbi:MAG: 30S ribosomal protein S16 [Chloroflexota bacterium]